MSTISSHSRLADVSNAALFRELTADNFAILAEEIGLRLASYQNGVPTTIIGPTAGTYALAEFWRDALGGEFRCLVAGTPGTWVQIRPAAVTADPSSGTIPTRYLILNVTTDHNKRYAGGYVWEVPEAWGGSRIQHRPGELALRCRSGLRCRHAARQDALARGWPMRLRPSRF